MKGRERESYESRREGGYGRENGEIKRRGVEESEGKSRAVKVELKRIVEEERRDEVEDKEREGRVGEIEWSPRGRSGQMTSTSTTCYRRAKASQDENMEGE